MSNRRLEAVKLTCNECGQSWVVVDYVQDITVPGHLIHHIQTPFEGLPKPEHCRCQSPASREVISLLDGTLVPLYEVGL